MEITKQKNTEQFRKVTHTVSLNSNKEIQSNEFSVDQNGTIFVITYQISPDQLIHLLFSYDPLTPHQLHRPSLSMMNSCSRNTQHTLLHKQYSHKPHIHHYRQEMCIEYKPLTAVIRYDTA
jgi:hypothetical protein